MNCTGSDRGCKFRRRAGATLLSRYLYGKPDRGWGRQEGQGRQGRFALQGIRILVVDDDADAREFLHFALTLEEAEVKVARSAKEALEVLNQFQPNVIVSDIGMPEEDGYSLLRQVRSQTAARGAEPIPAIALTAFARESDRQSAIAAGFQRHLAKPVVVAELVAAIADLIQSPL
ncbi:response regulator [Chroococcidiopsis cubana]|uniref:response regulator n=1 Tax=Chroococcidiopsis cubana TaxID=171392 RepID=UPI002ACE3757|nr:response regulator [Chroococcidiopsis cubana]